MLLLGGLGLQEAGSGRDQCGRSGARVSLPRSVWSGRLGSDVGSTRDATPGASPRPPTPCPGRPDRRLPGGSPYSHQFKAVLLEVLGAEVDVLGRWVPQALPAGVQSLAVGQPQTAPRVVFLGKPAGPRARERDRKVRPGSHRPGTSSEPCPRADQEADAPGEIHILIFSQK